MVARGRRGPNPDYQRQRLATQHRQGRTSLRATPWGTVVLNDLGAVQETARRR